MEFWRGPAYTAFFEYLDSKGGFYYEVRSFLSFQTNPHHLYPIFTSAGVMHLYTQWQLLSSLLEIKSISLTI
jgi:Glycolipid 2-alpha-mannosyltransferase